MQPGFGIKILPRKADIIGDGFGENLRLAEGKEGGFPDHSACCIHNLLRCTEVVADNVIYPDLRAVQFQCNEVAVLIDIIPERRSVSDCFSDQAALEVVVEIDGRAGDGLFDSPPEGIVLIFRLSILDREINPSSLPPYSEYKRLTSSPFISLSSSSLSSTIN